jgi:hypothetical protein
MSSRYASPAATWKEFRSALIARDRKRALACLSAGSEYADILNGMETDELSNLGSSLEDLRQAHQLGEEHVQASVDLTAADGDRRRGPVLFVKVNGNWLIASL